MSTKPVVLGLELLNSDGTSSGKACLVNWDHVESVSATEPTGIRVTYANDNGTSSHPNTLIDVAEQLRRQGAVIV